jgi:hypothetical protein
LPKKYYDVMDPFVTLSAAAAVTKKLKVGTGICLVVQRDPIQTAKSVASLDQISKGRFLFGIGAGWNEDEMANHGTTDFKGRFKLMEERVRAMREIWTQSKPEFNGDPRQVRPDDDLAEADTEAAAGDRRRHVSAWRAARDRLRRRLGSARDASRVWGSDVLAHLPAFREMARRPGAIRRRSRSRPSARRPSPIP